MKEKIILVHQSSINLHGVFHGFHLIFNQSPVENRPIVSDVWHRRNLPQVTQMLAPMMRRPQVTSSGGWGCGYADWKVVENGDEWVIASYSWVVGAY